MDILFKTICGLVLCCIICMIIPKQSKELTLVIVVAAGCMACVIGFQFLEPTFDFVENLAALVNLNSAMTTVLLKAVGIGLLSEFAISVCDNSGNAPLGKTINFVAGALLISLSVPYLTELLKIVTDLFTNVESF